MDIRKHAAVNTAFGSLALTVSSLPFTLGNLTPAVLSGFLMDVDHVVYEIYKQKTLSPRKIARAIIKDFRGFEYRFYLFHTLEFGIVFSLIVYNTSLGWPWAFGYWVHLTSDIYYNYKIRNDFSWMKNWVAVLQGWKCYQRKRSLRKS